MKHGAAYQISSAKCAAEEGRARLASVSPPFSYVDGDLGGNLQRRVSGVGAARVDVDDHVVSKRQRTSTAPAGGTGVLLSRSGAECAIRVGYLRYRPQRLALRVGVLAAGRPLLGGGFEKGTGCFHGREQDHRLLEVMREVIAVVEALIALGPITAVAVDR